MPNLCFIGYNLELAPDQVSGYSAPVSFGSASINAPVGSYMGYQYFPFSQSQGFTADTCASYCNAQTSYNLNHPSSGCTYTPCTFFDAYVLYKNGVPQGLYCTIYNSTWDSSYATNKASYDQQGNTYNPSNSYGYSLLNPPAQPATASGCTVPTVQDANFESGSKTYPYLSPYWSYSTTDSAQSPSTANGCASPAYEGSCAFAAAMYGRGPPYPSVTLSQSVNFNHATSFQLTFWYKFDEPNHSCSIRVTAPGGSLNINLATAQANVWLKASMSIAANAGSGTLQFYFYPSSYIPQGNIYIDNIQLSL